MDTVAMNLPACANNEVNLKNGLCGTQEEASRENHPALRSDQMIPIATLSVTILIIIVLLSVVLIRKFKKGKI